MDLETGGKQPEWSKIDAFAKLEKSNTCVDLRIIIGILGLYSQFLPLYELNIQPWRYILSKMPQPGKLSQKEDMVLMQTLWTEEPVFLYPLVDQLKGFGQALALFMIQHIFISYGEIDELGLEENEVNMMGTYDPTDPLALFIEQL